MTETGASLDLAGDLNNLWPQALHPNAAQLEYKVNLEIDRQETDFLQLTLTVLARSTVQSKQYLYSLIFCYD